MTTPERTAARRLVSASAIALLAAPAAYAQAAGAEGAVEEVVVTGSRLQATGFTTPTPVTTLTSEALMQRAPSNVAQALYDLPALTNNGTARNTFGSTTIGMNQLNLRNLGATRTLVLVDGRRYVPSSTTTAFDTNLIPAGLVDRTEVVTGGASAAYGSDAVAGVVNILLKERLEGLHGFAQGGQSIRNDGENYALGLSGGIKLGERAHFIAGGEYAKEEGVGHAGVGPYARSWGAREYGVVGLGAGPARPAGQPANVVGQNVEFSRLTPGSVIVSGPLAGTAFGLGGAPFALQPGTLVGTALMINPSRSNYGYFPTARQPLKAESERYVLLGHLTFDITDHLTAFVEGNYGRVEGHNNTGEPQAGPGGQIAPAGLIVAGSRFAAQGFAAGTLTNPFIPAATLAAMDAANQPTIALGRAFPENGGFSTNNTSDTKQIVVGLRGDFDAFGGAWKWDAYGDYGRNKYTLDVPNVVVPANLYAALFPTVAGGQLVCGTAALNAINPNLNAVTRTLVQPGCVPFNPFGPARESAAALAYIQNHMFYHIKSEQYVAAANVAGSPFSTWAGEVSVAAGVEYRKNASTATADRLGALAANLYGNYQAFTYKPIKVTEGYFEVGVPLAKDMPFFHSLDVNAAVRRTHYSTSGNVTSWKVGGTWEPTDFLRLRATKSRDIRAPNLGELYASTGGVAQSGNPFAPNQAPFTAPAQVVGNPNLIPERADTFTAGVVFQPRFLGLDGLRMSIDYYKIDIKDVIANAPLLLVQSQCFGAPANRQSTEYCSGIFVGYDPTFQTSSTGYVGLRTQQQNLNNQKTDGIDVEVAYRIPLDDLGGGQLDIRALGAWLDDLDTLAPVLNAQGQVVGKASQLDQAGAGANPEFRYTVNFNYANGPFSGQLQLQGFSKVKFNPNLIGPENPAYADALTNTSSPYYTRTISKNLFAGKIYTNVAVQYRLIDEGNRRLQVYANVDNLFDVEPPFGWVQNLTIYDTVGTTWRLGVRFDY
jgi:outer membrane receptor protein involved in Fe transport